MKQRFIFVLLALLMQGSGAFATESQDREILRVTYAILFVPFTELVQFDSAFTKGAALNYKNEVLRNLYDERKIEAQKVKAVKIQDSATGKFMDSHLDTVRHDEVSRILDDFEINFPFYWRMKMFGFDIFTAQELLENLKTLERHRDEIHRGVFLEEIEPSGLIFSNNPAGDIERIKSLIDHDMRSRRFAYRFHHKLVYNPLFAWCTSAFMALKPP